MLVSNTHYYLPKDCCILPSLNVSTSVSNLSILLLTVSLTEIKRERERENDYIKYIEVYVPRSSSSLT